MANALNDDWGRSLAAMLKVHWAPATGLRVSLAAATSCLESLRRSRLSAVALQRGAGVRGRAMRLFNRNDEAEEAEAEKLQEGQRVTWLDENIANLSRAILSA